MLATSWTPNSKADVWTFKIRQGVKFHNGQPLTADDVVYTYQLHTNPKGRSNALSAFGGVLAPGRGEEGRRLHGGVPPQRPERELPVPDLLRQLQHDHPAEGLRPGQVGEHVPRHRAVQARLVHAEVRGHVHPQRGVLGQEGAALADPVHLLRHPEPVDPGADRRDDRRGRAVLRRRRRGTAHRQLQHHQAEVQRAPPAVHAQRQGPVHRPAGPAGDRAHASTGPQIVQALFKGYADVGNDSPFAPVFPSTNTSVAQRTQDIAKAKSLLAAAGHGSGFSTQLVTENFVEIPQYAQIVAQSAKAIGVNISLKVESSSPSTTARPSSAAPTGWTPP